MLKSLRAVVVAAICVVATSCSPTPPDESPTSTTASQPPTIERWSGLVSDYRSVWTAEPGIDLLNGAPMIFRAYVESTLLAQFMGNVDYAYPGYTRAVPANAEESERPSEMGRAPYLKMPLQKPFVGNTKHHILRVVVSGPEVIIDSCDYGYLAATEEAPGIYVSAANKAVVNRHPNPGISVGRTFLRVPPPETAPIDLPPQKGPALAPYNNVFGDWTVIGGLSVFASALPGFDEEWPTFKEDEATCVAKAPDSPERRAFLMNGEHPRSDFPTLPAYPGWPSKPD